MQTILTICIPTYNRCNYLSVALERLKISVSQCSYPIEVIISDNHSIDETQALIQNYIESGLECRYIRNSENIGPDANFVQCFNQAKGKYVWLIGDDDYLKEDSLQQICEILATDDFGLIHIDFNEVENKPFASKIYDAAAQMLSDINIMITFMTGNIIRKDSIADVDGKKYFGSYLVQVPYYINAALTATKNVVVHSKLLETGADSGNNGGYNFFRVFMDNYFSIWREFVDRGVLSKKDFKHIKEVTFQRFHRGYVERTLLGQPSQALDMSGCVSTIWHYFKSEPYFYRFLLHVCKVWLKSHVK